MRLARYGLPPRLAIRMCRGSPAEPFTSLAKLSLGTVDWLSHREASFRFDHWIAITAQHVATLAESALGIVPGRDRFGTLACMRALVGAD